MTKPNVPAGFDPTDPDVIVKGIPHAEFAELRKNAPVWWVDQEPGIGGFDDNGYWAVTSHDLIREVSRDDATYSSWENTAIIRFADHLPRENIELQRHILLNKDAPEHTKLRGVISRGFTPRAIARLRSALTERAEHIVNTANEGERGDFVTQLASELPLQAIAELIGVPQDDRGKIFDWSNQMMGYDDPDTADQAIQASAEILGYSYAMAEDRKVNPQDDLVTKLLEADIDGHALSSEEFGFFVILLAVAGNETTRNAITHGILAFMDNPEQWELFKAERPSTMADEIVRWASPVTAFQRTATRDTELGGVQIKKGDRVGIFYASGNFDEEAFDTDPQKFDITRDPNPHLGFGGTGAHFCIGTHLARLEIDLIFNTIADVMPDLCRLGDPEHLRSGWLHAIKSVEFDYRGGCPVAH